MRTNAVHGCLLLLLVSLLGACEAAASLGARCTRASDCESPLVCGLGRCRAQCSAARDCPAGQVCLEPTAGAGVCELPTVDVCAASCDAPLVCVSGHCRQMCDVDSDCPSGHACRAHACERADTDAGPEDGGPPGDAGTDAAQGPPGEDAGFAGADVGIAWACDPIADTGCGGGQRCGLSGGIPTCIASGAGAEGAACATETSCGPHLSCQGGRCVRFCYDDGNDGACGSDRYCGASAVAGSSPPSGIAFCSDACDPLAQVSTCPTGSHCAIDVAAGNREFRWCAPDGTGAEGATCIGQAGCNAGLECVYGSTSCRAFCDPSEPMPCAGSHHCDASTGWVVAGHLVGFCVP